MEEGRQAVKNRDEDEKDDDGVGEKRASSSRRRVFDGKGIVIQGQRRPTPVPSLEHDLFVDVWIHGEGDRTDAVDIS